MTIATTETPGQPRDYRRKIAQPRPVLRSSDCAKPGDLILARDRVIVVPAEGWLPDRWRSGALA